MQAPLHSIFKFWASRKGQKVQICLDINYKILQDVKPTRQKM